MLFLATGVTLIAPWPAVFWYQTGVPFESRIIAYVLLPLAIPRFPVRYQPGGGSPGLVTASGGKSLGRHRIQYEVVSPDWSGALTTSA